MTQSFQTTFILLVSTLAWRRFDLISTHAFVVVNSPLSPILSSSSFTATSSLKATIPTFEEVCETTGVTLTRFMNEVEKINPDLAELAQLIAGIQTASKAISNLVKRSQLPSSYLLGYEGNVNVQGEDQKKLDVITNDVLKRALKHTGSVGILASEEEDTPMNLKSGGSGDKEVVYDEGSSYVTVRKRDMLKMCKCHLILNFFVMTL
jgi:fructose-1,6-bisphosphatase I